MAQEFQESEAMFHMELAQETEGHDVDPKYAGRVQLGEVFELDRATLKSEANKRKKTCKNTISSVPMNIPDDKKHWFNKYVDMEVSDEDYCGGTDFAPPHVIIGHRVAGTTIPFSVCTGNGRTLKGRDLNHVRNSILRMTGFLET
ncbi:hypothetical protein Leryth_017781 [Lithospermum erythrorhizon]|nr:hypothetical protein Leryth_017781 [Lithospermum erythrorhizon]